jgi:hypothetical protein
MATASFIATRVSPETKARFSSLANRRQISESGLLKRLINMALLAAPETASASVTEPVEQVARDVRLYVRLRTEDHVLLRERAAGREMAAATYASILLRAHLRALRPLPDRELAELKRSIAALGMIGRNLNQIARAANQTGTAQGPSATDLRALLRALEGLRDHVKALVHANIESWETGNAEAPPR